MASVLQLYLQYRLWIADMNSDINILRIFDDHFTWLSERQLSPETAQQLRDYKHQFADLRKELDDLRHELHLTKMKLGTLLKQPQSADEKISEAINHKETKERCKAFRKKFSRIRKEFKKFEG